MQFRVRFCLLLVVTFLLPLLGCAKNVVPLTYMPAADEVIPIAGAPSICVVSFADARPETSIGVRQDNSPFTADIPVTEWISQALAAELTRLGYVVTAASNEQMAKNSGAKYILTGSVEEVWMVELSTTNYECKMRTSVQMRKNELNVLKNSFNTSLSRRVVPLSSVPKEVMAETLRDLVHTITMAVRAKVSS